MLLFLGLTGINVTALLNEATAFMNAPQQMNKHSHGYLT